MSPIMYKRNTPIKDIATSKGSGRPISSDQKASSILCRSASSRMQIIDITRNLTSSQESREGDLIAWKASFLFPLPDGGNLEDSGR